MKILVTGATGFIGSHVAVRLARAGHQVVATGRDPLKVPALENVPGMTLETLELGDLSGAATLLHGCDALVHVALGWGEDGPSMLRNDAFASVQLFEAARQAGVGRVVYTSSTAANGEMSPANREDRQTRPEDFYGASKAATEQFARVYAAAHGMRMHVVRPGYIFGEPVVEGARTQPDDRFRRICAAVKDGSGIELVRNDGTQFLHVDDLAELYEALLTHEARYSIHNALSTNFVTWEEVARMAMEEAGREVPVEVQDKGWGAPSLFDVTAMARDFELAFLNRDRLRAHVKWQLENL